MPSMRRLPGRLLAAPFALIALFVAACGGSDEAYHSANAPAQPVVDDRRLLRFFGLMDEDGNGSVSRPEFQTGKGMVFMAIDADDSLGLTQNEMRLSPDGFKTLAGDDGVVSGEEFQSAKVAGFEAIDADQNLELTYDELRGYLAKYE